MNANSSRAQPDPWDAWGEEAESSWLLSYVDILSLILALMVVLLGHTAARHMAAERQVAAAPPVAQTEQAPPTPALAPPPAALPVEKAPLPPTPLSVAAELMEIGPPPRPMEDLPLRVTPLFAEAEQVEPHAFTVVAREEPPAPEPAPVVAEGPPEPTPEERLAALVESRFPGLIKALRSERSVSLEIADAVLFPSARAELSPLAIPVLTQLAQTLLEAGEVRVAVEGHTDDRPIRGGRFASNWELSAARAAAVTGFLVKQGLDPARLRSVGYADTRPVADNGDGTGRALNRRVNLVVEFETEGLETEMDVDVDQLPAETEGMDDPA